MGVTAPGRGMDCGGLRLERERNQLLTGIAVQMSPAVESNGFESNCSEGTGWGADGWQQNSYRSTVL